jgi:polyvinyl alcohol dehydrogenase (cytochrome)
VAQRVRDGKQKTYTIPETAETGKNAAGNPKCGPSGASIWSVPTLDPKRNLIYVTTGDNFSSPATLTSHAVLALGPATGRIVWSRQMTA